MKLSLDAVAQILEEQVRSRTDFDDDRYDGPDYDYEENRDYEAYDYDYEGQDHD
jgi:hypothetical protein